MILLALDPSLSAIGWCVMDTDLRDHECITAAGVFKPSGDSLDLKLTSASKWLDSLAEQYRPETIALEVPVVAKNIRTTIKLAQLSGALRLTAFQWTERTIEVYPGGRLAGLGLPIKTKRDDAKRLVTGHVNSIYGLDLDPKREHDIADAVAVAHAAWSMLRQEWF